MRSTAGPRVVEQVKGVRARVGALLALAVVGTGIIALPDTGPRILSLSETHGPSLLDAVGVVLVLAAWVPVPIVLVRRRRLIPRSTWAAAGVVALVAGAALAVAIRDDLAWWWVPVLVLLALQLTLVRRALTGRRRPDAGHSTTSTSRNAGSVRLPNA